MITCTLVSERDILRKRWHDVRTGRLELKKTLIEEGSTLVEIRHNSEYKILKKEQRKISTMIKHIENKICRAIKNESK